MRRILDMVLLRHLVEARYPCNGDLPPTGSHLPTHPVIYEPILRGLEEEGLAFDEEIEVIR